MTRWIALLVLLLSVPQAVHASGYVVGYQNSSGYVWNGSYWLWPADGTLWSRTTYPAYDSYGRYYLGVQYVQYHAPKVAKIDYSSKTWKEDVIKLLGEREERALFDKTMTMLGQTSTAPLNSGGYDYYSKSQYGGSGTTIYGHATVTTKDIWGDQNAAVLYQSAAQHLNMSREQVSEASRIIFELVGQDQVARARVAEIFANRDAAVAFLHALKTQQTREEKKEFRWGPTPPNQPNPKDGFNFNPQAFEQRVINQCGACHAGEKKQGGFSLAAMGGMDKETRLSKVWNRLTHANPQKRMPLTDSGPGVPQTEAELREWWEFLFVYGQPATAKQIMPPAK